MKKWKAANELCVLCAKDRRSSRDSTQPDKRSFSCFLSIYSIWWHPNYKGSWKGQSGTNHSCHPDVKPATACRTLPRLVIYALFTNCRLNLEESCMITQFTGTIIKSLASSLFHYIVTALECFLHDQRQNLLPEWVTEHSVASEGATAWYPPPHLHSFRGPQ